MTFQPPRYLTPFHPKQVPHFFTDVLVIGGGLAGLRSALAVDPRLSTLVIMKRGMLDSNSVDAQGGVATVLSPQDSFEEHVKDTLIAGGPLCDENVVRHVVENGPAEIEQLVRWGTKFDMQGDKMALSREGGHGRDRIAHALGDATGREIMRAVSRQVRESDHIDTWEYTFTIDLLTHDGACRGAIVWNEQHGRTLVWAKQTILATGGLGQVYRETTNPAVATGDGMAIAYRAGVELRDLEFVQFHPTVLYIAGSSRSLITEAMRGEGAYLVDRNGERFMTDYDERGELAPRDIVSGAIAQQMHKTQQPNVYLDLTHLDAEWVRERFPGIAATCAKFDIDITRDRIPVRPGAHYSMGGIKVDREGRTGLAGLWAAGEVSSTGLHGANRLASNSLLESLVYGASCGRGASQAALGMPDDWRAIPLGNPCRAAHQDRLDLADILASLRSLMWRDVGVRREAAQLREALEYLVRWCSYVLHHEFTHPGGWELQNMIAVSRLVVHAALERHESRGCHIRTDHPAIDDDHWCRHITFCRGDS